VLWAPTGFGKTVVAAALLAQRAVSTLVLVHRAELLQQWRTRLASVLDVPLETIGALGDGRATLGGTLDVALLQSLARRQDPLDLARYGHVVVDECHHVPAVSFEQLLADVPARYVTGLTATPIRRDGQHPIMQLQLGPIRWSARRLAGRVAPAAVRFERLAVLAPPIRRRRSRPCSRGSRTPRNDTPRSRARSPRSSRHGGACSY
jgi:superfamily II DNA or RNA helicase